jgi:hypothetical protein
MAVEILAKASVAHPFCRDLHALGKKCIHLPGIRAPGEAFGAGAGRAGRGRWAPQGQGEGGRASKSHGRVTY